MGSLRWIREPAAVTKRPMPQAKPRGPPPPPATVLADWLQPGGQRLAVRRGDGPELWIDADARVYGPQLLSRFTLFGTV